MTLFIAAPSPIIIFTGPLVIITNLLVMGSLLWLLKGQFVRSTISSGIAFAVGLSFGLMLASESGIEVLGIGYYAWMASPGINFVVARRLERKRRSQGHIGTSQIPHISEGQDHWLTTITQAPDEKNRAA